MILTNELKGRMVAKGYNQKQLAKALGMTYKSFANKIRRGVFGTDEVEKMILLLDIKDPAAIFFATEVTCEVTNEKGA